MKHASLTQWRREIDKLDSELLSLLAKRMEIVQKIGKLKQISHVPALDKKRWRQILKAIDGEAEKLKLSKKFVHELFSIIHLQSVKIESSAKR